MLGDPARQGHAKMSREKPACDFDELSAHFENDARNDHDQRQQCDPRARSDAEEREHYKQWRKDTAKSVCLDPERWAEIQTCQGNTDYRELQWPRPLLPQ